MTAMYKEEIPTASVTLTRPKEVIDTNTNVIWTTTITNTSKAPLQNLTLKRAQLVSWSDDPDLYGSDTRRRNDKINPSK